MTSTLNKNINQYYKKNLRFRKQYDIVNVETGEVYKRMPVARNARDDIDITAIEKFRTDTLPNDISAKLYQIKKAWNDITLSGQNAFVVNNINIFQSHVAQEFEEYLTYIIKKYALVGDVAYDTEVVGNSFWGDIFPPLPYEIVSKYNALQDEYNSNALENASLEAYTITNTQKISMKVKGNIVR